MPCTCNRFGLSLKVTKAVIAHNHTFMNIAKRDNPILDDTFGAGDTETEQVQHAFVDALALANAAVFLDIDKNGGIYERYFQPQDKATVRNVFMNILGDPPGDNQYGTGAALLGKITITHDDKGVCAETIGLAAEMYGPESDTPTMLICPEGFRHGGIGKDTNQVDCTTIGTTFSWRVKTLGSIVLHEYLQVSHSHLESIGLLLIVDDSHFKDLVSPP